MVRMIELGWGQANPAFHQAFSTMLMPDAPSALTDELNELQRASTSPAQAARIFSAVNDFDASADIARIMAPTLVAHARDDARVPLAEGRLIAAGARDARLVTLDGRNHVLVRAEPAFDQFVAEMHAFLDDGAAPTAAGFPSLNPPRARFAAARCHAPRQRTDRGPACAPRRRCATTCRRGSRASAWRTARRRS